MMKKPEDVRRACAIIRDVLSNADVFGLLRAMGHDPDDIRNAYSIAQATDIVELAFTSELNYLKHRVVVP